MNICRKRASSIFVYTLLILFAFVSLFPLLWAITASLRSDVELYKYILPFSFHTIVPVEWTLDAYVQLFSEFGFLRSVLNTLLLVAIMIPCGCLINSVAAFAFAAFDFRGKNIIFAVFLVSFMIPFESIAMPLYTLIDNLNWVDSRAAMVVPGIASGLLLFLFRQFFSDIPPSLIESARVDGAGWMRIYLNIIIPSSIPIVITAGLMLFMNEWNSYLWPLLVARSENIRTVQIMLASFKMEHETLWSCIYAGSVLTALIPICLFLPLQRFFVEGITSSGIKG